MAKDKKGFILYADQIDLFEELPDDKAGQLIKHIFNYVNDKNPETSDLIIKVAFSPIKTQLKRDLVKYNNICERNRINGSKGGRPKKPTGLTGNPRKPKKADIDKDNGIDKDKVKDIKERKQVFKTHINKTLINDRLKYKENKQEIINFFEYWSEHGINDKKMRFEKEKSFGIPRRLDTWFANAKKFNKTDNKILQKDQSDFSTPDKGW